MFKTWKEMRASLIDYNIVIDVTEHQISYALNHHPNTIDEFKDKLSYATYATINAELQKGKERGGEKIQFYVLKFCLEKLNCIHFSFVSSLAK